MPQKPTPKVTQKKAQVKSASDKSASKPRVRPSRSKVKQEKIAKPKETESANQSISEERDFIIGLRKGHPIGVAVHNTTDTKQVVRVLFPNAKREDNYGNANGVKIDNIYSAYEDIYVNAYEELLGALNGRNILMGAMAITAVQNNSLLNYAVTIHREDMYGEYHGRRLIFLKEPYQNQTDIIVDNKEFSLNNVEGTTGLILTLPPTSKGAYYLYPSTKQEPKE